MRFPTRPLIQLDSTREFFLTPRDPTRGPGLRVSPVKNIDFFMHWAKVVVFVVYCEACYDGGGSFGALVFLSGDEEYT